MGSEHGFDVRGVCFVSDHRPGHGGRESVATFLVSLDPITPALLVTGAGDDRPARHITVPPAAVPMLEEMLEAITAVSTSANQSER